MQPGHRLHFRGTILGENVSVRAHVMLAYLEFSIAVKPDADLVLSGEPFDVTVRTTRCRWETAWGEISGQGGSTAERSSRASCLVTDSLA